MINTANIAGTDGSVMVPVVQENGKLVAYLLHPDPTGIAPVFPSWSAILRQYLGHSQAIPPPDDAASDASTLNREYLFRNLFFHHKESPRWTGQLFLNHLKKKIMSTESSGVSADRIKNDPLFERTRENMAEFTRAGKAAKLMRTIFREVMINAKDKITQARLTKVFSRIVATDPESPRGGRTVNKGDLQQLQHFNFNVRAGVRDSFFVRCPISINRPAGQAAVNIPAFVPRNMVQQVSGITHFRIVAAAATINFDTGAYEYAMQGTPELRWDHDPVAPSVLTLALPANSPDTIVVVLGIEYYQRVNSRSYALKTGEHNATSIVAVDVAA